MTDGQRIIGGLQEAIDGKVSRVTVVQVPLKPNPGVEEAVERLRQDIALTTRSDPPHPNDATVCSTDDLTAALAALDTSQREREEALALLLKRYVTPDLVKLVGQAMKDIADANEMVCRLRGEADANADLKRFIHYVDHEHYMSPGEVSRIIDFGQGQMARAERAETALSEALVALKPFAEASVAADAHYLKRGGLGGPKGLPSATIADFRLAASTLAGMGSQGKGVLQASPSALGSTSMQGSAEASAGSSEGDR